MITIQIPETQHMMALEQFKAAYGLPDTGDAAASQAMVLLEDGRVLGYGGYGRHGEEGVVELLFVDPAMRRMGFGDGLLRALLNLMERQGITRFYIGCDEAVAGFLKAEDLALCSSVPDWVAAGEPRAVWFEGELPAFFQKPCKGGR